MTDHEFDQIIKERFAIEQEIKVAEAQFNLVKNKLIQLKSKCRHTRTYHISDASGGHDSEDVCLACGERHSKAYRK